MPFIDAADMRRNFITNKVEDVIKKISDDIMNSDDGECVFDSNSHFEEVTTTVLHLARIAGYHVENAYDGYYWISMNQPQD